MRIGLSKTDFRSQIIYHVTSLIRETRRYIWYKPKSFMSAESKVLCENAFRKNELLTFYCNLDLKTVT